MSKVEFSFSFQPSWWQVEDGRRSFNPAVESRDHEASCAVSSAGDGRRRTENDFGSRSARGANQLRHRDYSAAAIVRLSVPVGILPLLQPRLRDEPTPVSFSHGRRCPDPAARRQPHLRLQLRHVATSKRGKVQHEPSEARLEAESVGGGIGVQKNRLRQRKEPNEGYEQGVRPAATKTSNRQTVGEEIFEDWKFEVKWMIKLKIP